MENNTEDKDVLWMRFDCFCGSSFAVSFPTWEIPNMALTCPKCGNSVYDCYQCSEPENITDMEQGQMRTKQDERFLKTCKYFNGIQHEECLAGHKHSEMKGMKRPCFSDEDTEYECGSFVAQTQEELDEFNAKLAHKMECMRKKISPCCEAPLDTSQVIKSGRFKNHGPRFCSKCGKLVYHV